ncbi:hypothetical protein D9V29_13005 [Mycetocola manganoxydans]|uniref:Hydroxymethylpyrimidine pyrophosphatase-like HAD family hydrolase n=1 Tax=Mycetocola manganoxydans TaxID=699879 RepID=A0A3L6ZNP3_9MICO|nr:hypothetical protein [Mycetocola manganoxydans]RLP68642.1 hypothetical protein D9V29_13005 [Mycetocola manganoxydans]GHD45572.1 hypothetical protein GCM10008097_14990 [Mycetocola manganoxydans]
MTDAAPVLGLLLDVDGPIASPVSRSVAIPSIARDLVELANGGVPIVFNTGRSDAFIRDEVVPQLLSAGLGDTARVWAICEKGAVVVRITPSGFGEIDVDEDLAVPPAYADAIRELVHDSYDDVVFFDETKRAMVSVEQRLDVSAEHFTSRRDAFDSDAARELEAQGLGYEWGMTIVTDAAGNVPFRIDPTIISTDIESVRLGKDLGASKFLALLEKDGAVLPSRWRTMGDSRTDYAMADWLHERGYDVIHVDVRPADGVPETPYPVRHHDSLIHDDAGALYLSAWVRMLRGELSDDDSV